jgi:hypothetical protein
MTRDGDVGFAAGAASDLTRLAQAWRWHATALKDPARRQGGGPLAILDRDRMANAWGNSGRDEKTALQPNQKTERMTYILCEPRSNGIDTGRPVTEEHFLA